MLPTHPIVAILPNAMWERFAIVEAGNVMDIAERKEKFIPMIQTATVFLITGNTPIVQKTQSALVEIA